MKIMIQENNKYIVPSHILENRTLLLAYVAEHPDTYPLLPLWAQADEEIYFAALGKFDALKLEGFAFPRLLMTSREIAKKSILIYPEISWYLADELRGDIKFAMSVALSTQRSAKGFLSFSKDQSECDRIATLSDYDAFSEILAAQASSDEHVQSQFEYRMRQRHPDYMPIWDLVNNIVARQGLMIATMSASFRDDEELAIAAIKREGLAYFYLSERLRSKSEIYLEAAKGIWDFSPLLPEPPWQRVPSNLRNDPKVMFAAIEHSGLNVRAVSDALSRDESFLIRLGKAEHFRPLQTLAKKAYPDVFEDNPSGEAFYQYLVSKRELEKLDSRTMKGKPAAKGRPFKL